MNKGLIEIDNLRALILWERLRDFILGVRVIDRNQETEGEVYRFNQQTQRIMTSQSIGNEWLAIASYIRDDEELASWFTEAELNTLAISDIEELKIWSLFSAHQGFDIKRILKFIKRNFDSYMNTADESKIIRV